MGWQYGGGGGGVAHWGRVPVPGILYSLSIFSIKAISGLIVCHDRHQMVCVERVNSENC